MRTSIPARVAFAQSVECPHTPEVIVCVIDLPTATLTPRVCAQRDTAYDEWIAGFATTALIWRRKGGSGFCLFVFCFVCLGRPHVLVLFVYSFLLSL